MLLEKRGEYTANNPVAGVALPGPGAAVGRDGDEVAVAPDGVGVGGVGVDGALESAGEGAGAGGGPGGGHCGERYWCGGRWGCDVGEVYLFKLRKPLFRENSGRQFEPVSVEDPPPLTQCLLGHGRAVSPRAADLLTGAGVVAGSPVCLERKLKCIEGDMRCWVCERLADVIRLCRWMINGSANEIVGMETGLRWVREAYEM